MAVIAANEFEIAFDAKGFSTLQSVSLLWMQSHVDYKMSFETIVASVEWQLWEVLFLRGESL